MTAAPSSDPPPPPPPPWAAWQPPPVPRRRGAAAGLLLVIVVVLASLGLVTLRGGVDEAQVAASLEELLDTIDRSERRMIAFSAAVSDHLGPGGLVDVDAVVAAAEQSADDLRGLQRELRGHVAARGDVFVGLRVIRDAYDAHMQAWIDYLDAVAGTPTLALPDSPDAGPLWTDINTTGDRFVDAMEEHLPQDIPDGLADLARFILERGFTGAGDDPGTVAV